MRDTEEQAIEAALRGELEPLGQVLEQYRPRLERMIAFRLNPRLRGRFEPADVLQDAMTRMIETFAVRFPASGLELFLWARLEAGQALQDIHRRNLGALRRDARQEVPLEIRGMPGASSFAIASAILDASNTPSRVAIDSERGQRLTEALDNMKEVDREVLVLRHFEQLSNREVARSLELSETAATMRYVRALQRLRETLSDLELPQLAD